MVIQDDSVRTRVQELIVAREKQGFHRACGFAVRSYGHGKARVEMEVTEEVTNWNGTLHGGAIATLVDYAGTVAIMSADLEGRSGVSTDLNVTFFAPAVQGGQVFAEASVLKVGKTLAYVTVDVRSSDGSTLLAQGRMTKYQPVKP